MLELLRQRQKRKGFLYSDLYLWLLTAIVVCAWYFGQVILGFIAVAFIFIMVMCLHDDVTPALPVLAMATFVIPEQAAQDPATFINENFAMMAVLLGMLVLSIGVFFVSNRQRFKFGKQFIGLAIGAVAFLCSGLLYDVEVWKTSILSVVMFVFVIFLVYLVTVNGMTNGVPRQYLAKIFMHVGIVIAIQTALFYLLSEHSFEYLISTKALRLGWGLSNNVGAILLLTIPMTIYLVVREDKTVFHTIYYMVLFIIQLATLVLSLSRGALLAGIIGIPVCMIYACVFARNKSKLFISFSIILVIVAGIVAWQWEKLVLIIQEFNIFGNDGAIQDSGRFKLYMQAIEDFLKSPITGLSPMHKTDSIAGELCPLWYHCTPLQCLANAGIFGAIGYVVHLICKYRVLCTRNSSKINRFILIGVAMWSLYGLLDPCYSIISQLILFVIIMAFAEYNVPQDFKVFGKNKKRVSGCVNRLQKGD